MLSANVRTFELALGKFADKTVPGRVAQVTRAAALETARGLISMTPVDTGRLRGNWQVGVGASPAGFNPDLFDKLGDSTLARALRVIATIDGRERVYVTNRVRYGPYINDGTPKFVGNHMVELTVMRVASLLARGAAGRAGAP